MGRNDQNAFSSGVGRSLSKERAELATTLASGHGASISIHRTRSAISRSRQLVAAHRHREVLALVPDGTHEKAFLRIANHDGRAGIAAVQNGFTGVEAQAAERLIRVADEAIVR